MVYSANFPSYSRPNSDASIAVQLIVAPGFQALDAHLRDQTDSGTYLVWGRLSADLPGGNAHNDTLHLLMTGAECSPFRSYPNPSAFALTVENREIDSDFTQEVICLTASRIRSSNDEQEQVNSAERFLRWTAITVLSVVAFGGLYLGIHLLH
jgi:hypothetical protein